MKEQLRDIFNSSPTAKRLKLNRRIQVIIVCILIATSFWFLIALSKDYTTKFILPVTYANIPGKKVVMNDLPSSLELTVKTKGFNIISYHFNRKKPEITIDVASKSESGVNSTRDVLVIPSSSFSSDFTGQLGSDNNILSISPDSIVFSFSNKITKRVPVKADLKIAFEKQFDATIEPVIIPDSVTLEGPFSVIGKLNFIRTVPLHLENVKSEIKQNISLLQNKLMTMSDTSVQIFLPVEKFTEGTLEVPVHFSNLKSGYSLKTFPDKISVSYIVSLSKFNQVNVSMFDAVADASGLPGKNIEHLNVKLTASPSFLKSVSIEPQKVDYILHKK